MRNPNGAPVIFQQGTYAPGLTDGIHRWMGSIAMDGEGNMALGYSASNDANPAVFPSVYYTGRFAGDPPGIMTLGEGTIIAGTGSQTGSLAGATILLSGSIRRMISLFGTSTNGFRRRASVGWRLRIGSI